MQQQTRLRAKELLDTQLNVKDETEYREHYSNEQLKTKEQIEGTPFTLVGLRSDEPQGSEGRDAVYFGTLGRYRITENKYTAEEIREELQRFSWDLLLKILGVIVPSEITRILEEISNSHKTVEKQEQTADESTNNQQ